jgi:hypothetical protein
MIDIVQKYMREMQPEWKRTSSLVYEHRSCNGQSKLTLDAIRSKQADYYDLPGETRIDTSPNSSNQKIMALDKVKHEEFRRGIENLNGSSILEGAALKNKR